jgi:hypothetical protein
MLAALREVISCRLVRVPSFQWHATSINMSLSLERCCAQGDDKMNTLYFGNNLKRQFQIRPVSVAQIRQERLRLPAEHKFPIFLTKKYGTKNSI